MKKLYYIKTNGYDMVASQENGVVKYITESLEKQNKLF